MLLHIFSDQLGDGILTWLDDILGYAEDEAALLTLLDKVLARCESYGLKLHAKKCTFFSTEVKWGGRIISAQGVKHCPERVQGLVDMQLPRTGAGLQQFLCAVNWMRQSIPEYTRISAVLYDALGLAAKVGGSRKKKMLANVDLVDVAWGAQETAGFEDVRQALLRMVPLAYPSPSSEVCLYSDASQDFWGAVVTHWSRTKSNCLWRSNITSRLVF
ncbi:unnamed protein product [Phytophthora fragariaefolia]|uniref:Unnamed protein product n=1 Tax=Phytophthora fragariaefolia TaxID=1490495 RepID=A0A9W6X3A0_9STRA|nr:unnamed protein product [Phytophthora fragariaefolia]